MFSQVEDRGSLLLLLLLGTFKGGEVGEKKIPCSLCVNVCFCWENRLTCWISVFVLKCHGVLLVWTSMSLGQPLGCHLFFKAPV